MISSFIWRGLYKCTREPNGGDTPPCIPSCMHIFVVQFTQTICQKISSLPSQRCVFLNPLVHSHTFPMIPQNRTRELPLTPQNGRVVFLITTSKVKGNSCENPQRALLREPTKGPQPRSDPLQYTGSTSHGVFTRSLHRPIINAHKSFRPTCTT